jgi:hypothetical protein
VKSFQSVASLSEIASTQQLRELERLGIVSVRDLAEYAPCRHAELLVGFFDNGTIRDLDLNLYFDSSLDEEQEAALTEQPASFLKTLNDAAATRLADTFDVQSLRDLATFDLYLEARRRMLDQALDKFQERPSAPRTLLPEVLGSTYGAFRFSNYIREREFEFPDYRLGAGWYPGDPISDESLSSMLYRTPFKFYLGYLALLKQRWVSAGTHLGEIIHSLGLAPGESRNIAQLDWYSRQQSARSEDTTASEVLTNEFFQNRAVNEVVQATAQEHQYGGTEVDASTKTTGFGLTTGAGGGSGSSAAAGLSGGLDLTSLLGLPAGVGGSGGGASTSAAAGALGASFVHGGGKVQGTIQTESSGTRQILAQTQQNISDMTVQNASNVRSLMSTVVIDDSQLGGQSSTTRNVTNYNHMHALTIQYYEVLHKYRTSTRVESLMPVLYLPFKPFDFDMVSIQKYWPVFYASLKELMPAQAKKWNQVVSDFSPDNGAFDSSGSVYVQSATIVRRALFSDQFKIKMTVADPDIKLRISNSELGSGVDLSFKGNSTYLSYKLLREQSMTEGSIGSGAGASTAENLRLYFDASAFKEAVQGALKDLISSTIKNTDPFKTNMEFNELHPGHNKSNLTDYIESGQYSLLNPSDRIDFSIDVEFQLVDEHGNAETVFQTIEASYTFQQLHSGVEHEILDVSEAIEDYLATISDINSSETIAEIEAFFHLHRYGLSRYLLSRLEKEQVIDLIEQLEVKGAAAGMPLVDLIDPAPLGIVDNLMIFPLKCGDGGDRPGRVDELFEYRTRVVEKQSGRTLTESRGDGRQVATGRRGAGKLALQGFLAKTAVRDRSSSMEVELDIDDTRDQDGNFPVRGAISVTRRFGSMKQQYDLPIKGFTQQPDSDRISIEFASEGIGALGSIRDQTDAPLRTLARAPLPDDFDLPAKEHEYILEIEKDFLGHRAVSLGDDVDGYCDDIKAYEAQMRESPLNESVFLPSAGVFAEAILGRSNSAEYIDTRRFYNWQDSPIPNSAPQILAIDLNQQRAAEVAAGLDPTVADSTLSATPPTQYAMPTGLSDALSAIQNGSMFRDMSASGTFAGILENLSQMATTAATTAGQLSGEAAANALDAAVKFGEQVAGLTGQAMDNARAAVPSTPTEKGGTLNALDGIGENPEPRSTNPVSTLDAAKADAVGSSIRDTGTGGSGGANGETVSSGGSDAGGGSATPGDEVEVEFPAVEIVGSGRPWLYDSVDYLYKKEGVYAAPTTTESEAFVAEYTNPIVLAAISAFSSWATFSSTKARDLASAIDDVARDSSKGAPEIYEARLLMERIWLPDSPMQMTAYPDLWVATLSVIEEFGSAIERPAVQSILEDVSRTYAQDKWQEAMVLHVSQMKTVHNSLLSSLADAGTAYTDFAARVNSISGLIGKSTESASTLTGVFSKTVSVASVMLKIYDLAIFLVDSANESIAENTEEEKRAYLVAYSNYFEHIMQGKPLPVREGTSVTVPSEFESYLDTLSYLDEENTRRFFEYGWRAAQDYVRAAVEDGGFDGLMFALSMLVQEHPNSRERLKFIQRRLAGSSPVEYPLGSTYGRAWFRSDIKW